MMQGKRPRPRDGGMLLLGLLRIEFARWPEQRHALPAGTLHRKIPTKSCVVNAAVSD